jgi:hypothetical protein
MRFVRFYRQPWRFLTYPLALLLYLLLSAQGQAQSGAYWLTWVSFGSGGQSSNGGYTLQQVVGAPVAGVQQGGGYTLALELVNSAASGTPVGTPPTPTPTATPITPTPPTPTPSVSVTPPAATGDGYEIDDSCTQARTIATDGSQQSHTFHSQGDADWVQFPVRAGFEYLIEVTVPPASPANVVLDLYDACAQLPLDHQDHSFTPGARLRYQATEDGAFWLQLVNHESTVAGIHVRYELSVRQLSQMPQRGAVIIVAGKIRNNDPVGPNIYYVTDAVRQLFIDHDYSDDRIYYLAPDEQHPHVDGLATAANLETAITTWAADKVGPTQALTIYLMDHGSQGYFYLDKQKSEWVTPVQINNWLNGLEAQQPGLKVNVIIEACYAGSFIRADQSLSKAGRLIITSTDDENLAWASDRGARFSDHLLGALQRNESLYNSFREAQIAAGAANRAQRAWLDGDGNGQPEEESDRSVAAQRGFIFDGTFSDDAWPPYLAQVEVPTQLVQGRGQLRAEVRDDLKVAHVWAVIYPPSYVAPTTSEALIQEALQTVKLLDQGNGWYAATYPGFTERGTYRIVFFAEDEHQMPARPVASSMTNGSLIFLPLVAR